MIGFAIVPRRLGIRGARKGRKPPTCPFRIFLFRSRLAPLSSRQRHCRLYLFSFRAKVGGSSIFPFNALRTNSQIACISPFEARPISFFLSPGLFRRSCNILRKCACLRTEGIAFPFPILFRRKYLPSFSSPKRSLGQTCVQLGCYFEGAYGFPKKFQYPTLSIRTYPI